MGSKEEFPALPKPQRAASYHRSLYLWARATLMDQINNKNINPNGGGPVVPPPRNSQSTPREVNCHTAPPAGGEGWGLSSPALSPIPQVITCKGTIASLPPPQVHSPPSSTVLQIPPPLLRDGQGQTSQNRVRVLLFFSSEEDFAQLTLKWKPAADKRNRCEGQLITDKQPKPKTTPHHKTLHSNHTCRSNCGDGEMPPHRSFSIRY